MKKGFKVIGISLGLIILLVIGVGYNFISGLCEITLINSSTSPDKNWKVIVFERNCGATMGFSSQISLIASSKEHNNEAGNIYIAEGYPKDYIINWESDDVVRISGTKGVNYKKEKQFNGIQFRYD